MSKSKQYCKEHFPSNNLILIASSGHVTKNNCDTCKERTNGMIAFEEYKEALKRTAELKIKWTELKEKLDALKTEEAGAQIAYNRSTHKLYELHQNLTKEMVGDELYDKAYGKSDK